jgi:inorganic triphosphatase YgiF
MASEVKMVISYPGKIFLTNLTQSDIITRYMKNDFMVYESDFAYYDTPDWALAENDYMLRVCSSNASNAVTLRHGTVGADGIPGLYRGSAWLAILSSPETIVHELSLCGAPEEFTRIASGGELAERYYSHRSRRRATLYLPEYTRIDFALDEGELRVEDKTEHFFRASFTLSYGDIHSLTNYCTQISKETGFPPDAATIQQKALRLLRSRDAVI